MVVDYRTLPFRFKSISDSGKHLGRGLYWRIYALENGVRIIVHSILAAQLGTSWFALVADKKLKSKVLKVAGDYANHPVHATPGKHEIYYIFLPDLTKIISFNSNQFVPVIPDVNNWIIQLEGIRIPRNLVGHMNWPNPHDVGLIEAAYKDLKKIIQEVDSKGIVIEIP